MSATQLLKISNVIQLLEMFGKDNTDFTEEHIFDEEHVHRKATSKDLKENYTERGGSSGHRMRMDVSHQLPYIPAAV